MVGSNTDRIFDAAASSIWPFMLLSGCKWVSGASGEHKFGILLGGLKSTYHALRPRSDLRIWKSKHFLMYDFSAADQSTAAGHEDLSRPPIPTPTIPNLLGILLPSPSSGCDWPWRSQSKVLKGLPTPHHNHSSHTPLSLLTPRPSPSFSFNPPSLLLHSPCCWGSLII